MTDKTMDCGSIAEPPGEVWILVDDMTGRAVGICPGPCETVVGCHAVEYRPAMECRSVAGAAKEIRRRAEQAEALAATSEKYPVYRDQLRARRDAFRDALDILSNHTEQESKDRGGES